MNAMYEKKLALQAESYMQLKVAYEELSQVGDANWLLAFSTNPRFIFPSSRAVFQEGCLGFQSKSGNTSFCEPEFRKNLSRKL